jgi:phage protein D
MPADTLSTISANPRLLLDGAENVRLSEQLQALEMTEEAGGLSHLELSLSNVASLASGNAEYAFDAGGPLAPGTHLKAGFPDDNGFTAIFEGVISAIEGRFSDSAPPLLHVLAEDGLQKARLLRRSKVYENTTLADILRSIASDHGLQADITGLDLHYQVQVQMNESDLAFARRLLERQDGDLQLIGNTLHAGPKADLHRGDLELRLGDQLLEARVTADLADQINHATVKGWDPKAGQDFSADKTDQGVTPGNGDSGASLLSNAFGAERSHHTCHAGVADQAEADALASSIIASRARRLLRVHGVAVGTPSLRVGAEVSLRGLGDWFSSSFRVTRVTHRYSRVDGYRCHFQGECARLPRQ